MLSNKAYLPYFYGEARVITFNLNVAEIIYKFLQLEKMGAAKSAAETFMQNSLSPSNQDLLAACKLKLELRKTVSKEISLIDALGYSYALENGLLFLTGDDAFKGLKNVQFVK
jgi:hypothetical protein